MKVMLLVRDLAVGGSQRQLALLAAGLARRGHDVAVVVLYAGGALEALLAGSGARLLSIGKSSRWHAIAPLARLRRLFLSERPHLVYAFLPAQTTIAALLLLLPPRLDSKLVFGLRAGGMQLGHYDALNALTYRSEAWLSRRADLAIANARAVRADAIRRGLPPERIAVVPNGIDTETMRPDAAAGRALRRAWDLPDDAFVIGCMARLDPMKDHANLLRAAAGFARENPDARFVCAGDGPLREELERLATSLGLADRVVWAGEIADARAAYNAFDIATLSSAFGEGFPNVVGEAMACGIPVAATDVGDVRLIVDAQGEVVPPKDPDALRAAWGRLRQRLAREPALPAAVRGTIVASYGVELMVRRTEDILIRLAAERPAQEIAREFA
jgi:glycosyltransferase involved in cell wall biosynthesis